MSHGQWTMDKPTPATLIMGLADCERQVPGLLAATTAMLRDAGCLVEMVRRNVEANDPAETAKPDGADADD